MRREEVGGEQQAVGLVVDTQQVGPPWSGHWYQLQLTAPVRTQYTKSVVSE